jgi:hypothetical protein
MMQLTSLVTVFGYLGRIVTILALCSAIGLHWIALQSVAWTTMVIEYSKHASLRQAITQTFDGTHPCSLCHTVHAGKQSEKKSNLQLATPKIDIIFVPATIQLSPSFILFEYASSLSRISENRHSPPVPPPRFLLS